jgi:hypothetical protein
MFVPSWLIFETCHPNVVDFTQNDTYFITAMLASIYLLLAQLTMVYNAIIYNQGGTDLRTAINRTRCANKLERRKIGCTLSTCWKHGSSSSGVWGWQRGRGGSKPSVVFADVSAWPLLGVISQLPVQITTLVWYRAGKCFMIACHGHRGRSLLRPWRRYSWSTLRVLSTAFHFCKQMQASLQTRPHGHTSGRTGKVLPMGLFFT